MAPPPPPASHGLDALRRIDPAGLTLEQIGALADTLGIDPFVIRAILRMESAAQGFAADGRPIIRFEPAAFSQLTAGRYDASHPHVSDTTPPTNDADQSVRWPRLAEAHSLDAKAAFMATRWGIAQTSGHHFQACGFADVDAFVASVSHSESNQLAALGHFLTNQHLADALQWHDWARFAAAYDAPATAARYARHLQQAFSAERMSALPPFLAGLTHGDHTRMSTAQLEGAAQRIGCDVPTIRAIRAVECGGEAYDTVGRPKILFEPHLFSRFTQKRYDVSHPQLSHPRNPDGYSASLDDVWAQLAEAYELDADAALRSTSWGGFQILGDNHGVCGFPSASAFVADYCQSEDHQLKAFELFVHANHLEASLHARDWAAFATRYNGPGQVAWYSDKLAKAYTRLSANA